MDYKDVYIKYLEHGRLNLYEYTYLSKEGPKAVYLIVDSRATEEDKTGTHFMIQLDEKQFKKQLKPYFKDQPILVHFFHCGSGWQFFCGHPNGIYQSTDKGKSWKMIVPTLENKVYNLVVSGKVIYAVPMDGGC